MKYMMVLSDGETFADLDGCIIMAVPDDWDDDTVPPMAAVVAAFDGTTFHYQEQHVQATRK